MPTKSLYLSLDVTIKHCPKEQPCHMGFVKTPAELRLSPKGKGVSASLFASDISNTGPLGIVRLKREDVVTIKNLLARCLRQDKTGQKRR